jgi:putative SOS response-associated peptidase YedK
VCAQFLINIKLKELLTMFPLEASDDLPLEWNTTFRGFIKTDLAPVLIAENNKLVLRQMNFSLCPSWSKEFPYPWTTYNARMERPKSSLPSEPEFIYQIPTWRESFTRGQTCLVPMQGAIESSYFGTHAGKIIQFSQKNKELFFAVGIFATWVDKKTGEIKPSFALITDNPNQYFYDCGHDRSIFCLSDSSFETWLFDLSQSPRQRFDFLRKNRINLDWDVSIEREMKNGWQKRAPSQKEIEAVKVWNPK